MFRSLSVFAVLLSLLAGCSAHSEEVEVAPDDGAPLEEDEGRLVTDTAVTDVDLNAPTAAPVRVRAGVLTLWLDPLVVRERRDGAEVHVLRGRSSRKVSELSTFIHDDGFADARLLTPTTFEIVLRSRHELNSMLAGLPLFVRFVTASGVPNEHQARVVIAPRLAKLDGPGSIRFDGPVQPVYVRNDADNLRYRGRVLLAQTPQSLTVDVLGVDRSMRVSPRAFRFDLTFPELAERTESTLVARAQFASSKASARAVVQFAVASLGLTTKSAEQTWPRAECQPAVDACIAALGTSADFAACGSYYPVHACLDNPLR